MENKDDFYNNYNLVNEEDIEKAKKKPKRKKPIQMSSIKKGSSYESVSINKEVKKEEILEEEPVVEKQEEQFLVEYTIVEEKEKKQDTLPKIYVGYTPRLIISIVLVPILSVIAVIFLYNAFTVNDIENIRYTEEGIVNYDIVDNTINLDIAYQFKINEKVNLDFDYQVLADFIILEKDNEDKEYFHEKYEFSPLTEEKIQNKKSSHRENLVINTDDYIDMVNKYEESYEVETDSYLDIYLVSKYISTKDSSIKIQDESKTGVRINLSSPTNPEVHNLKEEKRVDQRPTIKLQSPGLLGLGVLFGIGAIFSLSQAILLIYSTMDQKSIYDKTMEKYLKKYKKNLIEVPKVPRKTGKKVTNLDSIKELNKLRKKLNVPMKYCIINNHTKCQFFIEYNKELYIYVLKAVDLEKKD